MAVTETITVYRGEQVSLNFSMVPAASIVGWTIVFTVARKANSPSKLITQVATAVDSATGTFTLALTEEQTDLTPGTYSFDVWRTDEGYEQVIAIGPFVVSPAARVPPVV
jgi:hypothetical protein